MLMLTPPISSPAQIKYQHFTYLKCKNKSSEYYPIFQRFLSLDLRHPPATIFRLNYHFSISWETTGKTAGKLAIRNWRLVCNSSLTGMLEYGVVCSLRNKQLQKWTNGLPYIHINWIMQWYLDNHEKIFSQDIKWSIGFEPGKSVFYYNRFT